MKQRGWMTYLLDSSQSEHSMTLWQWNKPQGIPIIKATFSFHFSLHRFWCPFSQSKSLIWKTWTEMKISAKSKLKSSCHQKLPIASLLNWLNCKCPPRKRLWKLWSITSSHRWGNQGPERSYNLPTPYSVSVGRVGCNFMLSNSWSIHECIQARLNEPLPDIARHSGNTEY